MVTQSESARPDRASSWTGLEFSRSLATRGELVDARGEGLVQDPAADLEVLHVPGCSPPDASEHRGPCKFEMHARPRTSVAGTNRTPIATIASAIIGNDGCTALELSRWCPRASGITLEVPTGNHVNRPPRMRHARFHADCALGKPPRLGNRREPARAICGPTCACSRTTVQIGHSCVPPTSGRVGIRPRTRRRPALQGPHWLVPVGLRGYREGGPLTAAPGSGLLGAPAALPHRCPWSPSDNPGENR